MNTATVKNIAPSTGFDTTRFGRLEVTEDRVISFVQGMPGFERLKRFILIDHDQEGVFKWLQAVDDPAVAFLLTDPTSFKPGYTVPGPATLVIASTASSACMIRTDSPGRATATSMSASASS